MLQPGRAVSDGVQLILEIDAALYGLGKLSFEVQQDVLLAGGSVLTLAEQGALLVQLLVLFFERTGVLLQLLLA